MEPIGGPFMVGRPGLGAPAPGGGNGPGGLPAWGHAGGLARAPWENWGWPGPPPFIAAGGCCILNYGGKRYKSILKVAKSAENRRRSHDTRSNNLISFILFKHNKKHIINYSSNYGFIMSIFKISCCN